MAVVRFGTDGIRGTTSNRGGTRLTPEFALRVGQAIGEVIRSGDAPASRPVAVIGHDSRISGDMLQSALVAGLLAQGIDVVRAGVVPTPAIAFLTKHIGASLGIVISASHNPADDNGIKVFGADGYKLSDEVERQIEDAINAPGNSIMPRDTMKLGRVQPEKSLSQMYIEHLVQGWEGKSDLSGKSVLLECANGATSSVAPEVFRRLGADTGVVSGMPDGLNINESYEYVTPQRFGRLVSEKGADIGVAFDGDGDRVILVDEHGQVVDGDCILAMLAQDMAAHGRLRGDAVVTTNMSNFGLHDSLRRIGKGIQVVETQVGDKYVLACMRANGYTLGGERSGHILILDRKATTGDGIYTALAVMAVMVNRNVRLSTLASAMERYPQFIESAPVPAQRRPLAEIGEVQTALDRLRMDLKVPVDINLRYSGTEDKVRLSIRGWADSDPDLMTQKGREAVEQVARIVAARGPASNMASP